MPRQVNIAELQKNNLTSVRLTAGGEPSDFAILQAEAGADPAKSLKKFEMTAYTGAAMRVGFSWPVVVDLAGMSDPNQALPILKDHDPTQIVGHTNGIDKGAKRIKLAGMISGVGVAAQEVAALGANGFPWQASIGASIERMEFVDRGESVTVNGRVFQGPVYVARKSTLREVSFVAIGADSATSAKVAATNHKGGDPMKTFEEWLQAKGFDIAALNDDQKATLKAAFEAEQKPTGKPEIKPSGSNDQDDPVIQARAKMSAELERQAVVTDVAKDFPKIAAQAVKDGWDKNKTELEVLRASRPTGPAIHIVDKSINSTQIEAAMCMALGTPGHEKAFKPEVLEAAHKNLRNISLKQILLMAAQANGYVSAHGNLHKDNLREVLHYAFTPLQAAFSTISLPGIFSNVANKELLAGYMEEDQTWREIAAVKTVNDFKEVTSYRMLDDMEYEAVGPEGEIKQGKLGEESYTRKAGTYAKMFSLTRTDIINDDLGAFDDLRSRLGRGAAKKFNNLFWSKFMNNSSFFTSGRGNFIDGADTALSIDGLSEGVTAFRKLRSPSTDGKKRIGNPVGGRPTLLLVPPELEHTADQLYLPTAPGATTQNTHQNKYKPVVVDWLSDADFTGNSATAWYLLRPPAQMAAIVASFLNGVQTPTVESAEADFNVLGVQFRGYHDFGVDFAEYLAGIKSKGQA
jgi:hypothetical protein